MAGIRTRCPARLEMHVLIKSGSKPRVSQLAMYVCTTSSKRTQGAAQFCVKLSTQAKFDSVGLQSLECDSISVCDLLLPSCYLNVQFSVYVLLRAEIVQFVCAAYGHSNNGISSINRSPTESPRVHFETYCVSVDCDKVDRPKLLTSHTHSLTLFSLNWQVQSPPMNAYVAICRQSCKCLCSSYLRRCI